MKIIFSELAPIYAHYTFPHAVYAQPDTDDEIPDIYSRGFLPYSNNPKSSSRTFYLARSVRIDLDRFSDSSENRRVARKVDMSIEPNCVPRTSFNTKDPSFRSLCMRYIDERFPKGAMSSKRFSYILDHPLTTHFIDFNDDGGGRIGTVLCSLHKAMMHYWFAFFDHHRMADFPLGKWLMWRCIHLAQQMDLQYIYLGTCYGVKSLYKARDFSGVEFFDGMGWNPDIKELKKRCREDAIEKYTDRYKSEGLI